MADVVGTAFVRIKTLTDKLAKDIEDNIKKGMKNANLEKASKDKGDQIGEDLGDGIADSATKTLKKRSKDIVPRDEITDGFDDIFADVRDRFGRFEFDLPTEDFFRKSMAQGEEASKRLGAQFATIREDLRNSLDFDDLPFFEETEGRFKRLAREIRDGDLGRSLDSLDARFKSLGRGASLPSVGRLTKALGLVGVAIIGALPYIQDVGAAVLAYATGLVAQIGFLGTALGGVGVAAAAAIGAAATAALPIVLAFKAETDALVAFKDSMGAAGEEFLRIGVATQQTLLPALDEAVFVLGDLVPMFSEFGFFVGRSIGDFARLAASVLTGNVAQGRFQAILQSSLRILDILAPALINVGDILSGIWVAALPAAERFTSAIADLSARWAEMVNEGLRTGELTEKFDLWYDRAALLGGALGNVAGALFDILEVGATSADGVFRRFDEWAQRFRDFTESEAGQNRLALIFDNALSVMREVNAIAADLFDGIFGRLGEVGGVDSMVAALQRFRDVIPEIQEFWANAYVEIKRVVELFASNIWEKITQAWEQMEEPLGRLATQLMELVQVVNDSGAFSVFLDLMEILADVLSTLLAIPGFGTFVAYFIAFNGAFKVASIVLGPFLRLFGGFASLIINLIRISAGAQLAGMAGGLSKLATAMKAAVAAQAASNLMSGLATGASAAGGFSRAVSAAGAVIGVGGPLVVGLGVAGAALAIGGLAFFNHQQRAQKWAQEIRQATESLGLLNDGLNITAEGVAKYIGEFSRFEGRDQLDDLDRLKFSVASLGEEVAKGTLTYEEFANRTLSTGETYVVINDRIKDQTSSLQDLQEEYGLTDEEVRNLARGEEVYADGTKLVIEGNDSLLESFVELNKVIGAAAKESIGEFVLNAQNVRLLGKQFLNDLAGDIEGASDEDAAGIMAGAQTQLAAAAVKSSAAIKGLSDATRDQIREQSLFADGTVDVVKENQLLTDALAKQSAEIRSNLELFASVDFANEYRVAKDAVVDFVAVTSGIRVPSFKPDGLDEMLQQFPEAVTATDNLFRALEGLPEDEFNAAATAMGVDAGVLKEAMNGAQQAIIDLQNQAIETLPSIGELLDESTQTREDGSQFFDNEGFVKAISDRTRETQEFSWNITRIKNEIGDEAARLAAAEGPEAAANLVTMIGHDAKGLNTALEAMEESERQLKSQITNVLGPGIKFEYAVQAGLIGGAFGSNLASGLNSQSTMDALQNASLDTLNELARGFQGEFVIEGGVLRFNHTGTFRRLNPAKRRVRTDPALLAAGGLVDTEGVGSMFIRSVGTDTVPAMLTPGEYVNTVATVNRLGVDFFDSLNRGSTPAVPVPVGGGNINANGWTIVAPTPEESARQVISRFRSASFLLGGG